MKEEYKKLIEEIMPGMHYSKIINVQSQVLKAFVKQEITGMKTILSVSNLILLVVNLLCPPAMDIYGTCKDFDCG